MYLSRKAYTPWGLLCSPKALVIPRLQHSSASLCDLGSLDENLVHFEYFHQDETLSLKTHPVQHLIPFLPSAPLLLWS